MNTTTFNRSAPRLPAFAFAALMTLATLLGVGGLAEHSQADVQLAQAAHTAAGHERNV